MTLKIENHIPQGAHDDIVELQERIGKFKAGLIDEDRFKAYRLARGVYGQRQQGVQMYRIKLPYGKLNAEQLNTLAHLTDEYATGNLHLTTRQNVQMHYVKLEDTPQMWADLEKVGITTSEACGNTVRNVTASALAGIDVEEPFDVTPYAEAVFRFFLRNPIGQELGRKIKIAFSSSPADTAFTYFHDFGMIPVVRTEEGEEVRGFRVEVGGGLGAQAIMSKTAFEFLPADELIPFLAAAVRVFDRYGERARREKARMKFLLDEKRGLGLERFLELVDEERPGTGLTTFPISAEELWEAATDIPASQAVPEANIANPEHYAEWKRTNVFAQKQDGFFGILVKVPLGDIKSHTARKLATLVEEGFVADDVRVTIGQGLVLKFAREEALPYLYARLQEIGLGDTGAESTVDITACPGTDTCNLAVTNSTNISLEIEKTIREEFPQLVGDNDITIKISGCMNSCGQHMAASIGFHGSSIKKGTNVVPAMQVVIGGGVDPDGRGFIAEKVIKLPTKRIPESVRWLFRDYDTNGQEGEYFNAYFRRQGKRYFYALLKPLADLDGLSDEEYLDWGAEQHFIPEIGTGECAGVTLDVVSTIIGDAEEKLAKADKALDTGKLAESIYHSYGAFAIGAKALLLSKDIQCNTHTKIFDDFQEHYINTGEISLKTDDFRELVLQMQDEAPTPAFAEEYLAKAGCFVNKVKKAREQQLVQVEGDKLVVNEYYKA